MVRAIEFKDKRFKTEEDYNLMYPISNNMIILCPDYKTMDSFAKEIINTINECAEYNDYDCDEKDIGQAKLILSFGLQRILDINGQRITLALEPAIVYKANDINDIWFIDWSGGAAGTIYKESIYPMTIFKGSKEVWNSGLDEVYKTICNGRYGTYTGKWVNLDEKFHSDYRSRNCI